MTDINPFYPMPLFTVSLAATNSSGNVALPPRNSESTVRIYNSGTVPIFIAFGKDSTITASATKDMPIPPGIVEVDRLPPEITYMAGITAAGGGTIYFTPGKGI